jgi:hypothetical protein
MNLGEDYRRNIGVMYYSFDQNFLEYYGSNGVAAVGQAFDILNGALTNGVSQYLTNLSSLPLESLRQNYTAGALGLYDLKSSVLTLMMEQLGLADPIRYVWCLHDRLAGANCPMGNQYLVTRRNFDLTISPLNQYAYSSYINGVLYSYYIQEYCANPPFGSGLSEAISVSVDPQWNNFSPVASGFSARMGSTTLISGAFFTGLTQDDYAGLYALYTTNNINWENAPVGATLIYTNTSPAAAGLLTTYNYADLVELSPTNTDAEVEAMFPGIVIASSIPSFSPVVTATPFAYYTNYPWSPAGVSTLVTGTSYTTNVGVVYNRTYGNIVTNFLSIPTGYVFPNNNVFANGTPINVGQVTVIITNISAGGGPWSPVGLSNVVTNVTVTTYATNMPVGDFFIIPTNACGYLLISNVLTTVISTNITITATNAVANSSSNSVSGASSNFSYYSSTEITSWTQHNFVYAPVECLTNPGAMLHRGIEKIIFLRRDYDSLLGQYWYPQTATFNMITVSNSQNIFNTFQRVATAPDFLFTAKDMSPGPAANPNDFFISTRNINFNPLKLPNLDGPGTIDPPTTFTFNRSGPLYYNAVTNVQGYDTWFLDEQTATMLNTWGSYDDSTNAPVVYPNGTSLQMLENMVILQLSPTSLAAGRVGVPYSLQFSGAGGQPPYTWPLSSSSPGLPPGLILNPNTGLLSGTPTAAGTYDFIVELTDSNARFSDWELSLTIN